MRILGKGKSNGNCYKTPKRWKPYSSDDVPQDEGEVVEIQEKIYAVNQDYPSDFAVGCYSIQIAEFYGDKQYKCTLRYLNQEKPSKLVAYDTSLKLIKGAGRNKENAATLKPCPDCPIGLYKLLHIDRARGCIIFVLMVDDERIGCQLLMRESKIDNGVPKQCQIMYNKNCGTAITGLYNPMCKSREDIPIPRSD
ncbi:uncharacterized protein LOC119403219 [Rhipicephalus sanguineus]|uniref:uncharacterized protein LOC119403219 n=1 Tax=Rhipicephalus sanguineus TaxID=34632 RepID=UPI0020C2F21A|nr:uncharacterized protein LOC119403219 [Rhipicephalus sanguineus]